MSRRIECLYTHQKAKKRKQWSDGALLLHASGQCELVGDGSGVRGPLESRRLSAAQTGALLRGELTELELEGFLVSVKEDRPSPSTTGAGGGADRRFKMPRTVPRAAASDEAHVAAPAAPKAVCRGVYSVAAEELDEIWGATAATASDCQHPEPRPPRPDGSDRPSDRPALPTEGGTEGAEAEDDVWGAPSFACD